MKAYKHLIKHCLSMGCAVSVWDGEEYQVIKSTSYKAIIDAIESVEEAQLKIRHKDNLSQTIGWALVSAFGLEDDETVVDYTCTPFMNEWSEVYEATI
jgi:hypothetical protein